MVAREGGLGTTLACLDDARVSVVYTTTNALTTHFVSLIQPEQSKWKHDGVKALGNLLVIPLTLTDHLSLYLFHPRQTSGLKCRQHAPWSARTMFPRVKQEPEQKDEKEKKKHLQPWIRYV